MAVFLAGLALTGPPVLRVPTLLHSVPHEEALRLMHTIKGTAATAAATEELLARSAAGEGDGRSLRALGEAIALTLAAFEGHGAPTLSPP